MMLTYGLRQSGENILPATPLVGVVPALVRYCSASGERPELAYPKTSEVFRDFGSLAGRFPLAARLVRIVNGHRTEKGGGSTIES